LIRYFFGMLLYFIHTFIILLSIVATVLFNSNRLLLFVAMPPTGWFYKEYKSINHFTYSKTSILIIQSGGFLISFSQIKYQPTFFRIELCASLLIQLVFRQVLYNKTSRRIIHCKVLLLSTENVNLDFRHAFFKSSIEFTSKHKWINQSPQ
jgi:hypothetical protein